MALENIDEDIKLILESAGKKGTPVEFHFHGDITVYMGLSEETGGSTSAKKKAKTCQD